MEFKEDILILDKPLFIRAVQLHKGDVIFLNNAAIKELCNNKSIYLLKKVPLGNMQGMVTEIIWSKKKWWQFWKKKKVLGYHIEVL